MRIFCDNWNDPRLADYRSLKASNQKRWSNRFIAEGRFVVERLLQSRLKIHSILMAENRWEQFAEIVPDDLPVFTLPKSAVAELVGFKFHQGVLACAERPPKPRLDDLLAHAPERMTWAACSQVVDPVNLATIIRLCTAFDVRGLILEKGCADPFSRRVVRVSMGNVFRLPGLIPQDTNATLSRLQTNYAHSLWATVLDDAAEPIDRVEPGPRNVLLFGNEGAGLRPDWIDLSDRQITIPMHGDTDSLNVAVAAGIFLHHFDPRREG